MLAGPELCHHDLAVQQTDAASCAVVVGTAEEEAEEATACELKGDASGCTKRAGKGSCDFTAAVTVGWTSVRSSNTPPPLSPASFDNTSESIFTCMLVRFKLTVPSVR